MNTDIQSIIGRCPTAEGALGCDKAMPPLLEADPDHFVACFHYSSR